MRLATAGQYCVLPKDAGASLMLSGGTYVVHPAAGHRVVTTYDTGNLAARPARPVR